MKQKRGRWGARRPHARPENMQNDSYESVLRAHVSSMSVKLCFVGMERENSMQTPRFRTERVYYLQYFDGFGLNNSLELS